LKSAVATFFIVGGEYTASRDVARDSAHKAIGADNRNYLMQVQISFSGHPEVEEIKEVLGDFLGKLLPAVEQHLPDATVERAIPVE
jgi:hypothetical protein